MTDPTELPYRPCAGIVLTDGRGRVFAGERSDVAGAWQMPQGGIDDGETPEQAALREMEEEIGVRPDQVTVIGLHPDWLDYDLPAESLGRRWTGKWRGQTQRWLCARLDAGDDAIRLDTAHPEFARWRWMTPDEMLGVIVPFKRPIYAAVLGHFFPDAIA